MSRLELPLVALRGLTVLPEMMIHFDLSREYSKNAVSHALNGEQQIFLVAQKDPDDDEISMEALYTVGTIAVVKQVTKLPNEIDRVMVEGVSKAKIAELELLENEGEGAFFNVIVEQPEEEEELEPAKEEAFVRTLKEVFSTYVRFYPKIGKSVNRYFEE